MQYLTTPLIVFPVLSVLDRGSRGWAMGGGAEIGSSIYLNDLLLMFLFPFLLELITFEILAAERLRLVGFDNRLIIDCFANIVNILILLFSTNDRFTSVKYDSNLKLKPVLQE